MDPVDSVVGEDTIGGASRSGWVGDRGEGGEVNAVVVLGWSEWKCKLLSLLEITDDDLADETTES